MYTQKLKYLFFVPLAISIFLFWPSQYLYAKGNTLEQVLRQGKIKCGVHQEKLGFSIQNNENEWEGFEGEICRVFATAIFGDPAKVSFVIVTAQNRFPSLRAGDIDVLTRSTTWTLTRDTEFEINFAGPFFYDGQGFMVLKELNLKSVYELDGAKVCMPSNTTVPKNVSDFFGKNSLSFQAAFVDNSDFGYLDVFFQGFCDVVVTDISHLASARILRSKTELYEILPLQISKEPLSAAVRHGDDQWYDIIFWSLNVLLLAEDYGINSQNINEKMTDKNPKIQKLLGVTAGIGKLVGLDDKWAYRIIKMHGNYAEIYRRNIIQKLGLGRGDNKLWRDGGLLYPIPIPDDSQAP